MKTIIYACIMITFVGAVALANANEATDDATNVPLQQDEMQATPTDPQSTITDPTLAFFVALHACKAGDYEERNIMTSIVGPAMLQQKINGLEQSGTCSATLQTPDGRTLQCHFSPSALKQVADQHFMTGILTATTDNPSEEAQRSDMLWTQMKEQGCSFSN